jgi:hypothetical protein
MSKFGLEVSPHRLSVASREVIAQNVVSGTFNTLYDNVTNGLKGKEKEKMDKSVYDYLTTVPGVRKIIRKTRPESYEREKIEKKAKKYGVEIEGKPLAKLKSQTKKAEKRIMDMRQENDEELYSIFKKYDITTAEGGKKLEEFLINLEKKYEGKYENYLKAELNRIKRKIRKEMR